MNFARLVGKAIVKNDDGVLNLATSKKVYEELCLDEFTDFLHSQEKKLQAEMRKRKSLFHSSLSEFLSERSHWESLSEKYVLSQFERLRSSVGRFGSFSKGALISMAVSSMIADKAISPSSSSYKMASEKVSEFIKENKGILFDISSSGEVRLKK